jgi:hypothetical protein
MCAPAPNFQLLNKRVDFRETWYGIMPLVYSDFFSNS